MKQDRTIFDSLMAVLTNSPSATLEDRTITRGFALWMRCKQSQLRKDLLAELIQQYTSAR